MADEERDWGYLPPEILHLISEKLSPDISHFIRFRAVCTTWRLSAPVSVYRPQLPWILNQPTKCPNLHFYNLFQDNDDNSRTYTFTTPKYIDMLCRPSSHRYVLRTYTFNSPKYSDMHCQSSRRSYVLASDSRNKYSLLNPITNNHIDLDWSKRHVLLEAIGSDLHGEYLILSTYEPSWSFCQTLSFRQLAEPDKILFEIETDYHQAGLYYNGEYFYLEHIGMSTKVVDIATQKLAYEIPPPPVVTSHIVWVYMVESDGEILLMGSHYKVNFDIYRLNLVDGKAYAHWVKIDSIGDRVLFLDSHKCLSFSSDDCPTIGRDCIYILRHCYLYKYDVTEHRAHQIRIDVVLNDYAMWYIPSLC